MGQLRVNQARGRCLDFPEEYTRKKTRMKNLVLLSMVTLASCAPQSLVVTTTTISTTSTPTITTTTTTEKLMATEPLEMTKFHIKSEIQFRYARTVVESTVTNPDTVAQLASFALVIPDSAFISTFSMEIEGEERIQCLVEARGRLQGDRQFWERAFPGGFLSEEGAMLNTPD